MSYFPRFCLSSSINFSHRLFLNFQNIYLFCWYTTCHNVMQISIQVWYNRCFLNTPIPTKFGSMACTLSVLVSRSITIRHKYLSSNALNLKYFWTLSWGFWVSLNCPVLNFKKMVNPKTSGRGTISACQVPGFILNVVFGSKTCLLSALIQHTST